MNTNVSFQVNKESGWQFAGENKTICIENADICIMVQGKIYSVLGEIDTHKVIDNEYITMKRSKVA